MSHRSVVVGLTGQTGAGKSTVSGLLAGQGACIIDADQVARQVVAQGKQCLLDLVLEFGAQILEADGSLNRRRLGSIVFTDREKRKTFNQIIFPYIQDEIELMIAEKRREGAEFVILDAPTLFESGSEKYCDRVGSVIAPVELRRQRLLERDGHLTMEEIDNRIASQHDDEYYSSRSDFVICNEGSMTNLRLQVLEMLEVFRGPKKGTRE